MSKARCRHCGQWIEQQMVQPSMDGNHQMAWRHLDGATNLCQGGKALAEPIGSEPCEDCGRMSCRHCNGCPECLWLGHWRGCPDLDEEAAQQAAMAKMAPAWAAEDDRAAHEARLAGQLRYATGHVRWQFPTAATPPEEGQEELEVGPHQHAAPVEFCRDCGVQRCDLCWCYCSPED